MINRKRQKLKTNSFFISIRTILFIIIFLFFCSFVILKIKSSTNLNIENTHYQQPRYTANYKRSSQNPVLLYELNPNFDGLYDGYIVRLNVTRITINSEGFRDYYYPQTKFNNTFRIVAFGDSHTFGLGVELNDSYPKQLEAMLNNNLTIKYEVLNFGMPGYNTQQSVELFKSCGLNYSPNMIILTYFLNDDMLNSTRLMEIRRALDTENNSGENASNTEINRTMDTFKIAHHEIRTTPFEESWLIVENPLAQLENITKERKIRVIILILPVDHVGSFAELQITKLRNITSQNNWSLIDLSHLYYKQNLTGMVLNPLDRHPNALTYHLYAQAIYNHVFADNIFANISMT